MKVVILAGGLGTRLSEETELRPKPMVEIGGKPILWHIMKWYSNFGFNEFIICCGYKSHIIKEYFANYHMRNRDTTYFLKNGMVAHHTDIKENWYVTCVDTGADTMTGGRIRRIKEYIYPGEAFLLTYGDGVGNIDIDGAIDKSYDAETLVTMTAARSTARFGTLTLDGDRITSFAEKLKEEAPWVNAGYFVCKYDLFDYLEMEGDTCILEKDVLPLLAKDGLMNAYLHEGFWMPMDSLHDKVELEKIYKEKGNIYGQ
jgi:glucose-1-phosphate cytidylyltransferase